MEIDSKGFVKASGNLDIFNKKAKETADTATNAEKKVSSLDDVFHSLSPSALTAVAGITTLIGTFKGLTSAMKIAIGNFSHFESMQKGLETFFQDADKGREKFEELRKLSNETTFGVDELANSFTQLANVGVNVDTIKDKLIMLGNVSQGNKQKFAELVSIYSKIQSTGKASSVAIQQLALRGLPIYEMLRKIGVQGTATGEDVTRALEEMTKKGGQFYNAMNNINDTIEGKEGFISDYFKEMTVNFVEVTGIADDYKNALDKLKDGIGSVSDKLLEWNDNPLMKALLRGTLVTAITTLAGTIMTSLIPALIQVAKNLKLINSASGYGAILGLEIGVLGSLIGELKKQINISKQLKDIRINGLNEEIDKTQLLYEWTKKYSSLLSNSVPEYLTITKTKLQSTIEELTNSQAKRNIEDIIAQYLAKKGRTLQGNSAETLTENDIKKLTAYATDDFQLNYESFNEDLKLVKQLREELQTIDNQLEGKSVFDKYFTDAKNNGKTEVQLYEEELEKLQQYLNTGTKDVRVVDEEGNITHKLIALSDQDKADIKTVEDYVNGLIKKAKHIKTWQEYFKEKTGEDAIKKDNGAWSAEKYIQKLKNQLNTELSLSDVLGNGTKGRYEVYSNYVNKIEKLISDLLQKEDIDEPFKLSDNVIKDLVNELKLLKGNVDTLNKELNLPPPSEEETSLKERAVETITGATGDYGKFAKALSEGKDPETALIETALGDLAGKFSEISAVLNPISDSLDLLLPVIRLVGIMASPVAILAKAVGFLGQWLDKFLFGKAWKGIEDAMNYFTLEVDESTNSVKQLNEQYKNLNDVMRENYEYYYKEKLSLNANTYAEKAVRKVNDMILTPNGTFSTSPQDTIMAMKHPETLGQMNAVVNINNYGNDEVEVKQNGNQIDINIVSKQIASDFADGRNGWSNAYRQRVAMNNGRSVM